MSHSPAPQPLWIAVPGSTLSFVDFHINLACMPICYVMGSPKSVSVILSVPQISRDLGNITECREKSNCIGLLPNFHVMLALKCSSAPLVLNQQQLTKFWLLLGCDMHVKYFLLTYRRLFLVWIQVDHIKSTPHHLYTNSSKIGILLLLHSKRWTASRNSLFLCDFAYIYKFCYHDLKVI